MLKNPFFVYVAAFGAVLGIYQLGWSGILPPLSLGLLLFFGLTFAVAIALGLLVSPMVRNIEDYQPGLLPKHSGVFVVATFLVEVALNGIPLVHVLNGENFFAMEEVARHLHVFSLWSVYSTIRFADYLYSKRSIYLFEAMLPVIFYGLFVYRGPAMIVLLSWIFVFIVKQGGLKWKHTALAAGAIVLVFYANGKIGDIRSPGDEKIRGAPTASFESSGIPSTFFWTYLYATVPIGNFQLSVNTLNSDHGTIPEFIASELIPDTLSKRILPLLNGSISSGQGNLVSRDQLYSWSQPNVALGMNVSTIFGRSYGYFGWLGPAIMFTVLSLFISAYLFLIARSPYAVPSLALLNTLVVFCLFNNMLASAATIPLLVWPLLFPPWRIDKDRKITAALIRFPTVLAAAGSSLSLQFFEKALLIAVVLDLALGGNGYLIKIGPFRLREILYLFCLGWVALRLTRVSPIRLDAKLLGWCGLFAAITVFDTALGYFGGSRPSEIIAELKPLSYFPMLLFFRVAIRTRDDLTLIAALLVSSGILLASLYLLLMAAANMGLVQYSSIFEFLRMSDEFIFRHNPTNFSQPFIGFFYKGLFYVCIAALFLIFDPFKVTKILAAVAVVAIAMTLTRGLGLAVAICILAGIALSPGWKRAPLLLGQCGLLLTVLFFAQQAESRLATQWGTTPGQTDTPRQTDKPRESVRIRPFNPGNGTPGSTANSGIDDRTPGSTANSGIDDCASGSSCSDVRSSYQSMERPGDNDRAEDLKSFAKEVDLSVVAIGRGLGAALRGRERIEMNYLEVLYKQGILGLSLWLLLFLYMCQLYLAVPPETKAFGLAFFLSGLFVFVSTASNTFLTGSIGMGAVFISITSLLVLTQEVPHPMPRSGWYGDWLSRKFRV